jgi:hypothetical protein
MRYILDAIQKVELKNFHHFASSFLNEESSSHSDAFMSGYSTLD